MRLDSDGDLADFGHGVLGWIIRILFYNALSLGGFGPVLFEYAVVDPFLARSRQRLGQDTAKQMLVRSSRQGIPRYMP
jgi:hypothetical protein